MIIYELIYDITEQLTCRLSAIHKQNSCTLNIILCLGIHHVFYLTKLAQINNMIVGQAPNPPFKIRIYKSTMCQNNGGDFAVLLDQIHHI